MRRVPALLLTTALAPAGRVARFDQSSGTYAVQLSVPLADAGQRIGALTLTLKVRKEAATLR